MKNLLFLLLFSLLTTINVSAQDDMDFNRKGKILLETGYSIFTGVSGGTGLTILADDGENITSLGIDGGYFLTNDLALKARINVLAFSGVTFTNLSIGGKYYIGGKAPVEVSAGAIGIGEGDSSFLGSISIGYGLRIAPNINIEPSLGLLFGDENDSLMKVGINFAMFL